MRHSSPPSPALRDTARQSSLHVSLRAKTGGAEGIRTPDPHNAIVVLYQLSYDPIRSSDTLNSQSTLSKQNEEFSSQASRDRGNYSPRNPFKSWLI